MTWALLWIQHSPSQLMSLLLPIKLGERFISRKSSIMSDKGDVCASIQCFGATTSRICHPSKLSLPQKGYKPPRKNTKGSEKVRLKALKLRLRSNLVLIHKILFNQKDLEATHLIKFSRRSGLRRSSLRPLHQTQNFFSLFYFRPNMVLLGNLAVNTYILTSNYTLTSKSIVDEFNRSTSWLKIAGTMFFHEQV